MKVGIVTLTAVQWDPLRPFTPGQSCTYDGKSTKGERHMNVTSLNTVIKMAGLSPTPGKNYKVTIEEED